MDLIGGLLSNTSDLCRGEFGDGDLPCGPRVNPVRAKL